MFIELESKLKRHLVFSWLLLLIYIFIIIALVLSVVVGFSSADSTDSNSPAPDKYAGIFLFAWVAIAILGSFHFIIYILAIINAVLINKITNDSTLLIVFTVINFFSIAMLATTILERNNMQSRIEALGKNKNIHPDYFNKKNALKNAFMHNVITSEEYRIKLDELDQKYEAK